jgi:hypothetical protein
MVVAKREMLIDSSWLFTREGECTGYGRPCLLEHCARRKTHQRTFIVTSSPRILCAARQAVFHINMKSGSC